MRETWLLLPGPFSRLWIHFCAAYVFTGVVCYLLYRVSKHLLLFVLVIPHSWFKKSLELYSNLNFVTILYDLQEYLEISSKRIAYFYSSKPQFHQFTVLVRGIPVSSERSCSETVERFFTECYPSTYLSHTVVQRTRKLQGLIVSNLYLFYVILTFTLTLRI